MALPKQLKTARMTNATKRSEIDNKVGELESALADIFGYPVNTDITALALELHQSGYITNLPFLRGTTPGFRFLDTGDSDDIKIELTGGKLVFYDNTGSEGSPSWTERNSFDIATGFWAIGGSVRACQVGLATSVPNTTETMIEYDVAATYDTDNMHEAVINPERITIPAGLTGLWHVQVFCVAQATFSGTYIESKIKRNASAYVAGGAAIKGLTDALASFGQEVELSAADYLTNHVTHDHGGSKTIGCGFGARFIGPI